MEFNVSTFALEILNFLVLIWVLQRLFSKPLLAIINARKQLITESLAKAKNHEQAAEQQLALYENRQQQWEHEKQQALSVLQQQIEVERKLQFAQLKTDLEQERHRSQASLSLQQKEFQQRAEKQALENGAKFSALLLRQTVSSDLEQRLFILLLDKITTLPELLKQRLMISEAQPALPEIKVTSAYVISTEMRQRLEEKLTSLMNQPVQVRYDQDTDLIAGIRLDIGDWVLNANLKHELSGFAELAYVSK